MSSSTEYSGFSGDKPTKSPDKSTFSQTCSLLSQYLKEKGSLGDLSLGMACTTETNGSPEASCQSATTMNLFPPKESMAPQHLTTMDFLSPQPAYGLHSAAEVPPLVNSRALRSVGKEPKAAQLTIFYGGQVIVFDDFPADKVEEIKSFASKGICQSQNSSACTYTQSQPSFIPNIIPTTLTNLIQEHPQAPSTSIVCDLPIARKVSLHRFLEKRKDRIAAKAPYQTTNPIAAANKEAKSMSWLGLGAKSNTNLSAAILK